MASSAVVWHHPQTGELNSINSMTDGSGSIVASSSLLPNQSLFNNNSSSNSTITNKGLNIETESTLSGYNNDNRPKKNGRNGTAAYAAILSNNSANTSPGAIMLAQSPMANNIINPYHGNYQANNNGAGQVHSIVSMRTANSRHSQSSRNNGQVPKSIESPYIIDKNNRHEIVQVSMLTEDDNWQDNTTAITGNTSDQSGSIDDLTKLDKVNLIEIGNEQMQIRCQMWSTTIITLVLSICAFCSPIIMVILPRIDWFEWKTKECGPECDGLVISFVFKLFILAFGSWAVFFRRPKATMPRICMFRAAILALIVIFMISYWLFYSVRIAEKRFSEEDAISYYSIILFAISLVDALLFIHYLAVLLLYFRNMDTQYFVKVVRSPDGHSQCYSLGRTSIQRASVWILEKYYQDFPRYNPFAERIYLKKLHRNNVRHGLKYYDVDGVIGSPNNKPEKEKLNSIVMNPMQLSPKSILAQNTAANAGRPKEVFLNGGSRVSDGRGNRHRNLETASHHSGHSAHRHHRHHSDRFHEEHEYERRVRKRKSRLISVTEEAFTHIKRVQQTRSKFPIEKTKKN